jgi:O-glycosyl hydrolase
MATKIKRPTTSASPAVVESLDTRCLFSLSIAVEAAQQYQTMVGFGTSASNENSSTPYNMPAGSTEYNEFINDYVNDLGANLFRVDLDPDVLPNQPSVPLGTNLQANIAALNFNSPNASFFGNLGEALSKADGGKLQVMVTCWSPPAWMKADDSVSAPALPNGVYTDSLNHLLFQDNNPADNDLPTNNLDPATLTQFARYCAAYVAGMKQIYGLNIVAFSIQNEPLFDEDYASCSYFQTETYDPTDIQYRRYAEAIKAVGEEFEGDGISTQLVGPESVGPDGNSNQFTERQMAFIQAIDDDTVVDQYGKTAGDYLGMYAIHGWAGAANWTQYEADLNAEPIARPSWETEESGETQEWDGTNSDGSVNPLAGALGLADQIHDTLTYGNVSAYLYWQTANGKSSTTEDLMDSSAATDANPERTDVPQWKYLVFKHWSDFIAAGSVRVGTSYSDGSGNALAQDADNVNADAYVDNTGHTLTVELSNIGATAQTVSLSVAGLAIAGFTQAWLTDASSVWSSMGAIAISGGVATLTLPAYSVVTLQGPMAGSAAGVVYADTNANAKRDSGEAGVAGQTVFLDENNNGVLDPGEPSTTTASDGSFVFNDLAPGAYMADLSAPQGRQTAPAGGAGVSFVVASATATTGVNFGITQALPVAVVPGAYTVTAGRSVTLSGASSYEVAGSIASYSWDMNYNGAAFNPTASGATPVFSAVGLAGPSTRTVALEVTGADGLVSPVATTTITINAPAPTGASISGTVVSGGGIGVANETVYLDANNNSTLDAGELSTTTGSTGAYSFTGVPAGAYIIRQLLAGGQLQTSPANGYGIHVSAANGAALANQNFVDAAIVGGGSVSGIVSGAPAGETVYLDANNNGALDSGELSTTTASGGAYSFTGVPAGAYIIRQLLGSGYTQTSPANGYGIHITVSNGGSLGGQNFTDQASLSGGSVSGTVTNGKTGETIFLDANNNGVLDGGELSTLLSSGGAYSFTAVPPGAYIIRQVLPAGYTQTSPGNGYGLHITVANGMAASNQNFVDAPPPATTAGISGTVFNDANGDGKDDDSEAGLSGWTVYLDLTNSGVFASGDPTVITDSSGDYLFSGLAAGAYIVRVQRPSGYSQTTPSNNYGQHVMLAAGQTATGVLFGERS